MSVDITPKFKIITAEKELFFEVEKISDFVGEQFSREFQGTDLGEKKVGISQGDNIQDAIDLVNASGGGTVTLRTGTHKPDYNISIPSGVYLVGVSASFSIIDFQNGAYQIKIEGSNAYSTGTLAVSNNSTTVTGTGTTWTSAMVGRSIMLGGIWYLIGAVGSTTSITIAIPYAGETISAGTSYVIATINNGAKITDLTIKNSTASSILKIQYATEVYIQDIDIQVCPVALDIDDVSNITIWGLDIVYTTTSDGIQINNGHFIELRSVGIVDAGASGTAHGIKMADCTNASIAADFILNATGDGINMTDCDNVGILSSACTENAGQGIELVSGCTNISMMNMGCFSNGSDGIKLTGTDDRNIVIGCLLEDNGGYGINIAASDCDDNVILNNVYNSNSSGKINDAGTGTVTAGQTLTGYTATNDLVQSADTEYLNLHLEVYTLVKDILVRHGGTVRIKFDIRTVGTSGSTTYGKIYLNGVAAGTERSTTSQTYVNFSEDIGINPFDNVQLYVYSTHLGTDNPGIRNFRIYGLLSELDNTTVVTD